MKIFRNRHDPAEPAPAERQNDDPRSYSKPIETLRDAFLLEDPILPAADDALQDPTELDPSDGSRENEEAQIASEGAELPRLRQSNPSRSLPSEGQRSALARLRAATRSLPRDEAAGLSDRIAQATAEGDAARSPRPKSTRPRRIWDLEADGVLSQTDANVPPTSPLSDDPETSEHEKPEPRGLFDLRLRGDTGDESQATSEDLEQRGTKTGTARRSSMPSPEQVRRAQEHLSRISPRARSRASAPLGSAGSGTVEQGRHAKTRLLGFDSGLAATDPFAIDAAEEEKTSGPRLCPAGWLVVIEGPGRGAHFAIYAGANQIGRGTDMDVALDFGDTSISRINHAAVAFDTENNSFFLGQGGKSNLVRLNGRPVLSTEDLNHGDEIRLGETRLRLVALCGDSFSWDTPNDGTNG